MHFYSPVLYPKGNERKITVHAVSHSHITRSFLGLCIHTFHHVTHPTCLRAELIRAHGHLSARNGVLLISFRIFHTIISHYGLYLTFPFSINTTPNPPRVPPLHAPTIFHPNQPSASEHHPAHKDKTPVPSHLLKHMVHNCSSQSPKPAPDKIACRRRGSRAFGEQINKQGIERVCASNRRESVEKLQYEGNGKVNPLL